MRNADFTTTIKVPQSPRAVFEAINNVRGWWSEEIEGATDKLDAIFNYHFSDVHRCSIKVVELIPDIRVVWLVVDNYFKFTKDKSEWKGTKIIFDIEKVGERTALKFTHVGLVPEYECYEICERAWTQYVQQSLKALITTGKGQPNAKDKPQTDDEQRLSVDEQN